MKYHYDDILDALKDACLPLGVLIRQYKTSGFGTDELNNIDFQILFTIYDELRYMRDRIMDLRWLKSYEEME